MKSKIKRVNQTSSSSSSHFCPGQRLTPHNRTLEVRPGRITKKLELKYNYDCEGDDTKSLLGVLMLGSGGLTTGPLGPGPQAPELQGPRNSKQTFF